MRAQVLTLLLLIALCPMEVAELGETRVSHAINSTPAASGWVVDVQRDIGNGATVEALVHHDGEAVALLSHSGNGNVGSTAWSGLSTSHALVGVDAQASVRMIAHLNLGTDLVLASMDEGVLVVSNSSGEVAMMLVNTTTGGMTKEISLGGPSGPFGLLAADGAGDKAVVTLACTDTSSATQDLDGNDCTTTTGRQRVLTYAWTPSGNTTTLIGDAKWFDGSNTDLLIGSETGSMSEGLGPHPDCTQHLDVHASGAIDTMFMTGCLDQAFWSNPVSVDNTVSLLGETSPLFSSSIGQWGLGLGQSYVDPSGTESNSGWTVGMEDCSYAVNMDVEVGAYSNALAYIIRGQTSSNSFCEYALQESASTGPQLVQRAKWKNYDRLVIGDRWLNTSELMSATGGLVSVTATPHGQGSLIAVCHTGNLVQSNVLVGAGGATASTTMLAWTGSAVYNVTSFDNGDGCVEAVASLGGRLVLLQNDGFLQTISLVTSDSDGDGYGDISDVFPNNGQQWADTDGDGWGDNTSGFFGDDCPTLWGNSTMTRQGCTDLDGDGWPDTLDAYPNEPSQFRDSDGDGYGDNSSGYRGDDCPSVHGTSDEDVFGCLDSDRDGWSDVNDDFPNDDDQHTDTDGDGFGDNAAAANGDDCETVFGTSTLGLRGCPDTDGDLWADSRDPFPYDSTQWSDLDGDGYGDNPIGSNKDVFPFDPTQQQDSDGDGFGDNQGGTRGDACVDEYGTSSRDVFGCPDADGDGWSDDGDGFPNDASRYLDTDKDGVEDQFDAFPFDPTQWNDTDMDGYGDQLSGNRGDGCPTEWGDSNVDQYGCPDTDGDGWSDIGDGFDDDPTRWSDTDKDGWEDKFDDFPFDPSQWLDSDGDGFGDNPFGSLADRFPDQDDQWSDIDGDGWGDNPEGARYDAFLAEPTQWSDVDGDGCGDNPAGRLPDAFPLDATQCRDEDGDGLGDNQSGTNPDPFLFDRDNDGYNDSIDVWPLLASPGDMDNDGVPDDEDDFPANAQETRDTDGDGVGNNADIDDDDDGVLDTAEIEAGTDPLDPTSRPVESFEIVIPGTSVGLGAWDLIGVFLGVPLTMWVMFGLVTRGGRASRFEHALREATAREDLEDIATQYERAVMMRLLGPHQAIRLERMRTELDDALETMMLDASGGRGDGRPLDFQDEPVTSIKGVPPLIDDSLS